MKLLLPLSLSSLLLLSGCLKTRNEVGDNEQRSISQQQVVSMQRAAATSVPQDMGSRLAEMEEQMRELNGRIDVVENKSTSGRTGIESQLKANQQQNVDANQKLALLQDAMTKLEGQLFQLTAEVQGLKAGQAAAQAAAQAEHASRQAKKDVYEVAQEFFAKKDWKQAILNFQKYRDENPKGKNFPDATYKIGVSFQELGMKDEARTFYDEVVSKYPKTDEARRAKSRLKGLKK
jgi:TolA-binding protein